MRSRAPGRGEVLLLEVHEQAQKYTGPFDLPEPDDELRAMMQQIVDNEVTHVPVR